MSGGQAVSAVAGAASSMTGAPLSRAEILPRSVYELLRPRYVRELRAAKSRRRVLLGAHVSLQFECRETVLYEVHEILRANGLWTEADIDRELAEHGPLVPAGAELTMTVMIHGGAPGAAGRLCEQLAVAPERALRLRLGGLVIGAESVTASPDPMCPVHYLRFPIDRLAALTLRAPLLPAAVELAAGSERIVVSVPARCRQLIAREVVVGRKDSPAAPHLLTAAR